MDDEIFNEHVAAEIAGGHVKAGLWAKAFAQAGGNETPTKAIYIRLRVDQLLSDARKSASTARHQERAATSPRRRARIARCIIGGVLLMSAALVFVAVIAS